MEQFCDDNLLVWMIDSLSNDVSPKFLETNNFWRSTRSLRQLSTLMEDNKNNKKQWKNEKAADLQ